MHLLHINAPNASCSRAAGTVPTATYAGSYTHLKHSLDLISDLTLVLLKRKDISSLVSSTMHFFQANYFTALQLNDNGKS